MNKIAYTSLKDEFLLQESISEKVNTLLKYDLKTLTNPQIEKLLDGLSEDETKRLVQEINKKISE